MYLDRGATHFQYMTMALYSDVLIHPSYYKFTSAPLSKLPSYAPVALFSNCCSSPYCLIGSGCEGGVGGGGGGPPEREPRQTGARPTQANCSRPPEHELRRHHRRQSAAFCQLFSCQLDRGGHETTANYFKFCVAEESCWFLQ